MFAFQSSHPYSCNTANLLVVPISYTLCILFCSTMLLLGPAFFYRTENHFELEDSSCEELEKCFNGNQSPSSIPLKCYTDVSIRAWRDSYCTAFRCLSRSFSLHLDKTLYDFWREILNGTKIAFKHGIPSPSSIIFGFNSPLMQSQVGRIHGEPPYKSFQSYSNLVTLQSAANIFEYADHFPQEPVVFVIRDTPFPTKYEMRELKKVSENRVGVYFASNPSLFQPYIHALPRAVQNLTKWEEIFRKPEYCNNQINTMNRENLLLCSCITVRKRGERNKVFGKLRKNGFICREECGEEKPTYHEKLFEYKFVASPWGGGHGNHRDWEVLLAGAIPLLDYDPLLTDMFAGLPVVFIQDWGKVTSKFLADKWDEIMSNKESYDWKKLYAPYWLTLGMNAVKH